MNNLNLKMKAMESMMGLNKNNAYFNINWIMKTPILPKDLRINKISRILNNIK